MGLEKYETVRWSLNQRLQCGFFDDAHYPQALFRQVLGRWALRPWWTTEQQKAPKANKHRRMSCKAEECRPQIREGGGGGLSATMDDGEWQFGSFTAQVARRSVGVGEPSQPSALWGRRCTNRTASKISRQGDMYCNPWNAHSALLH